MKNLGVALFSVLFAQQGIGQTIFNSPELKKDIYKEFNEFVTNSPSIMLANESIVIDEDEKKLADDFKNFLLYSEENISF